MNKRTNKRKHANYRWNAFWNAIPWNWLTESGWNQIWKHIMTFIKEHGSTSIASLAPMVNRKSTAIMKIAHTHTRKPQNLHESLALLGVGHQSNGWNEWSTAMWIEHVFLRMRKFIANLTASCCEYSFEYVIDNQCVRVCDIWNWWKHDPHRKCRKKHNRMLNYNKPRGPNLIMCLSELRTFYSSIEVFGSWLHFVFVVRYAYILKAFLFIKLLPGPLQSIFWFCVYVYLKCLDSFFWRRQQAPCMLIIIQIGDNLFIWFSQFK